MFSMTIRAVPQVPATLGPEAREVMEAGTLAGLKLGLQYLAGAIREKIAKGPLHNRTGMLARSWVPLPIEAQGDKVAVGVGSKASYAAIQNFGGIIKPVNAKALTIPIKGTNLTPAGVARFPTVASLKQAMGAKNVFLLKRGGKAPLLMAKQGKHGMVPMFTLQKSTKIPASNYVGLAKIAAEPKVLKAMEVSMARAAKGGK